MSLAIVRRRPNFGLLWAAQLISFIGEGVFQIAMLWWMVQKTKSGTIVGLILSVSYLPGVLIGPFAGTLADRVNPKILLIGADLTRALLLGVFSLMASYDSLEVWHIFLLCALLSTASIFHSPTTLTVIPKVVKPEEIEEAMALHSIVRDLARLVGPALGGMIMAYFSASQAFAINSMALVLSALLISLIALENPVAEEVKESVFTQLAEGLRYVRSQKILFSMLTGFGLLNLFVIPIMVLLPLTVDTTLKLGSMHLGICEGGLATGSVLTGLTFSKLFGGVALSKLLVRTLFSSGILFVVFAVNKVFPVFLVGLFLLGGCFTAVNIAVLTLYQKLVAPEMKGRFFALVETICFAFFPISMALAGFLADTIGLGATYGFCAAGILLLSLRFALIPGLAEYDEPSS
jgi:MFS family permease